LFGGGKENAMLVREKTAATYLQKFAINLQNALHDFEGEIMSSTRRKREHCRPSRALRLGCLFMAAIFGYSSASSKLRSIEIGIAPNTLLTASS
jgi:hypothetical protein